MAGLALPPEDAPTEAVNSDSAASVPSRPASCSSAAAGAAFSAPTSCVTSEPERVRKPTKPRSPSDALRACDTRRMKIRLFPNVFGGFWDVSPLKCFTA